MSRFLTDLVLVDVDGETWIVHEDLRYESDHLHGALIEVPAGTKTDLASIPQLVWNIAPKTGLHDPGAVIHDWLYTSGAVPKDDADSVFYEAMLVKGVPKWRAWVMYNAVRWFGRHAWNSHRRNDAA
jgi:hypothetical protein